MAGKFKDVLGGSIIWLSIRAVVYRDEFQYLENVGAGPQHAESIVSCMLLRLQVKAHGMYMSVYSLTGCSRNPVVYSSPGDSALLLKNLCIKLLEDGDVQPLSDSYKMEQSRGDHRVDRRTKFGLKHTKNVSKKIR